MNDDSSAIRVNFTRAFPLFPLRSVALLPHAMIRLYIFEERYRQMVHDILDGAGQIAMAVYADDGADGDGMVSEIEGAVQPLIRPAVCIGQIAKHHQMPDGTFHLWMHGVCRAEVVEEFGPADGRLYRMGMLRPLEPEPEGGDGVDREALLDCLRTPPLDGLDVVRSVLSDVSDGERVPLSALVELVTLSVLSAVGDDRLTYQILEEPSLDERVGIVMRELRALAGVVRVAAEQFDPDAPQGVSWN